MYRQWLCMVTVDEGVVHAGRRFFVTENPLFLLFYRHRETFDSSLACKQVACFFTPQHP